MRLLVAWALVASSAPLLAERESPGPTPEIADVSGAPVMFAAPPLVKTSFASSEPFLEGEIKFRYTGRLKTTAISHGPFGIPVGGWATVPAGTSAYAMPMTSQRVGQTIVWIPVQPLLQKHKIKVTPMMAGTILAWGDLITKHTTEGAPVPYSGGEIELAPFDVGGPVRLRYYVKSLGNILRIATEAYIGDTLVERRSAWVDETSRADRPEERLVVVGGGVLGISHDPAAKDRYLLRVLAPIRLDAMPTISAVRYRALSGE